MLLEHKTTTNKHKIPWQLIFTQCNIGHSWLRHINFTQGWVTISAICVNPHDIFESSDSRSYANNMRMKYAINLSQCKARGHWRIPQSNQTLLPPAILARLSELHFVIIWFQIWPLLNCIEIGLVVTWHKSAYFFLSVISMVSYKFN